MAEENKVPYHLGIIMDGNRRWARAKGLPILEGHRQGYNKFKEVGKWCKAKGIKILSVFAFSTENWKRTEEEVSYLMNLLVEAVSRKEIEELHKEGIKLNVIGEKERLPENLQKAIQEGEELTQDNKEGILNLCISYGGRREIVEAIKKIIEKNIDPQVMTEETVAENLWTAGQADPDLIIRTSGEKRLSGFLTWQTAYSELYFVEKHWPDFTEEDLDKALAAYAARDRRFGK